MMPSSCWYRLPPLELSSFILPKGFLVSTAISVTRIINNLLITFGILASGQDLKKFLLVLLSIFLTLLSHLVKVLFGFLWQQSNLQVTVTFGVVSFLDTRFSAATLIYIGQLPTSCIYHNSDIPPMKNGLQHWYVTWKLVSKIEDT